MNIESKKITMIVGINHLDKSKFLHKHKINFKCCMPNKLTSNFCFSDEKINQFKIKKILAKEMKSFEELAYLTIINYLDHKIIVIDELYSLLNDNYKQKIIKYLKEKQITTIIFTNNKEDLLNADNVILFDGSKFLLSCSIETLYKEEKNLKRIGIGLPFIIDLSIRLKLYDLVDKIYFNPKDLSGDLWK